MVIAPLDANTLAKISTGISNNLLVFLLYCLINFLCLAVFELEISNTRKFPKKLSRAKTILLIKIS